MRAVSQADWVIDVGPGAEEAGGRIVTAGIRREVAMSFESRAAPFLAQEIKRSA